MSERLPRPAPRTEFRAALREQLLLQAPSALVRAPRTISWVRALAGAAATVTLVVAANTAAAQSLPGEPPFAIKRTLEEARLLLALDRQARVEVLADHAEARLAELQRATATVQAGATADASSGLAQALGRLADEVERLKRATPATDGSELEHRSDARGVGRAERVATAQAAAIEKLLPAADAPVRASLERAFEQARKIRATQSPVPPRSR